MWYCNKELDPDDYTVNSGVFTQESVLRCAQDTFVVTLQSRVRCRLRKGLRLGMPGEGVFRKYCHLSATSEVKKITEFKALSC